MFLTSSVIERHYCTHEVWACIRLAPGYSVKWYFWDDYYYVICDDTTGSCYEYSGLSCWSGCVLIATEYFQLREMPRCWYLVAGCPLSPSLLNHLVPPPSKAQLYLLVWYSVSLQVTQGPFISRAVLRLRSQRTLVAASACHTVCPCRTRLPVKRQWRHTPSAAVYEPPMT